MNQTRTMGTAVALLCATMAVAGGCSGKKNDPMAMNPGVTDISAVPPATPLVMDAPAPVAQPIVSDAPTQAPAAAEPLAAGSAGGKYTVQKGDTLWNIAATNYGDGKQWQRIASANPGLSPTTLKVGQTITLP